MPTDGSRRRCTAELPGSETATIATAKRAVPQQSVRYTGRMPNEPVILWSDGDWRGELHAEASGAAWLKIFNGDRLIVIESAFVGQPVFIRGETLRHTFCGATEARRMD